LFWHIDGHFFAIMSKCVHCETWQRVGELLCNECGENLCFFLHHLREAPGFDHYLWEDKYIQPGTMKWLLTENEIQDLLDRDNRD
jgi:hypothetical protein